MTYVHEGRHRLEDRPTAELEAPTDLELRVGILVAEMGGWGDIYPDGLHSHPGLGVAAGRPPHGRKSYIRTEVLRHAARLRTDRLDAARLVS